MQGVTLALAHSPRRVSKVSGERKSSITRPIGEYDFCCQEIIYASESSFVKAIKELDRLRQLLDILCLRYSFDAQFWS